MESEAGRHELRLRTREETSQRSGDLTHAINIPPVSLEQRRPLWVCKHILAHHPASPLPVLIGEEEVEGGLGHAVPVLVLGLEADFVLHAGCGVPEETQVYNRAGVDRLGDCTVRERIAVNLKGGTKGVSEARERRDTIALLGRTHLSVPRVLLGQRCGHLRFRVAERDW